MALMSERGVYMIENIVTGERYVGSTTVSFSRRWAVHKSACRYNYRSCPPLQEAWNVHGEQAFRFVILEAAPPETHLEREQYWMDHYRALGLTLYNRWPEASNPKGVKMPADVGARMSAKLTGRKWTEQERAAHPRWHQSESAKEKLREANRERKPWEAIEAWIKDWPPLVAPDGTVYRDIRNLNAFCRERGLSVSALRRMAQGKGVSSQGWTRLIEGVEPTPYQGTTHVIGVSHTPVAPDGTRYPDVTNLTAFCRDHGLEQNTLQRVCKGKAKHTHGWTCCPDKAR
jgi:group I intron endonuclease